MSSRTTKSAADAGMMPKASKSQLATRSEGPMGSGPSPLARGLGNAATAHLLEGGSRPIPPVLRARMEQSFGVDLEGVRVDTSASAQREADALNAEALVRDGQIHWSSSAPPVESPAAAPLLAHEVAHLVQQEKASTIENRVSSPNESSEVSARSAAGQVLAGQTSAGHAAGTGGAVAGTQRDEKPKTKDKGAEPELALQVITTFLQKVANTTPPQNIKKAQVVRDALKKLAFSSGTDASLFDVDKFLEAATTSADPATMARQFLGKVRNISAVALGELSQARTIDAPASKASRVKTLVEGSAAGKGPERPVEPGYKSEEEKAQEIKEKSAAMTGTKLPTTYGPASIDIFQAARIIKGIGPALKPQETKPAPIQGEDYPAVSAAIAKMPKDALIPAEAKGKGDPGEWASTAEFAADVARRMDVAQKSGKTEITVDLGGNYEGIKGREALRDAVEAIIQKLRDALPHHAADVRYVIVKTGKITLTRGMAETK